MRSTLVCAAIEKSSSLLSMTVKIQYHFDLFLLVSVHDLIFDEVNFRIEIFRRSFPPSVEVTTYQRTSVIPVDDTIWIDHGKNLEDKGTPQCTCLSFFREQKPNQVMNYPTGDCFPWMCPCQDDDDLLVFLLLSHFLEICNGQHFKSISYQGSSC